MKRFLALALSCLLIYMNIMPAYARIDYNFVSEAVILVDGKTGQVLYEKNGYSKMYPASTTKIMTGLLAVEHGNMADNITYSHEAVYSIGYDTSHASISEGEVLTLEQSMYAMAIESANDAANGIGEYLAQKTGTPLPQLMTERAKAAGARNTNFVNAHGLHDNNHYTTPYDLAMIARECIKYDLFNTIFSTEVYSIPPTNKQSQTRTFHSANWLLNGAWIYDGTLMSKTGWTQEATHTMVTAVERDGVTLIAVVMKSTNKKDKWNDTEALMDWGFATYRSAEVTGEYVALCADEEIKCDDRGRLFIEKENITATGTSVLLKEGQTGNDIKASFSRPVLSSDLTTATMTATLYIEEDGTKVTLTQVPVTATVSERTTVSIIPQVETSLVSDLIMAVLFGLLTFIAVMICDILIGKRI